MSHPLETFYKEEQIEIIDSRFENAQFPKRLIEGFLIDVPVFIVDNVLLCSSDRYDFSLAANSTDDEIDRLSKGEILDIAKYFFYVNNKYSDENEPTKISKRDTCKLFNVSQATFYRFLQNGQSFKGTRGYFNSGDMFYLQNQMIRLQNLNYSMTNLDEFTRYLTGFLRRKKFSEIAENKLREKINTLDAGDELVKADKFINNFSAMSEECVTTVGIVHGELDIMLQYLTVLEDEYSNIVEHLEEEDPTNVSSSTAKRVQKRLALSYKAARCIEKNRREIGANPVRNDEFVRDFLLNKDYIGKFGKFIFNCDETGIQLGERRGSNRVLAGANCKPGISILESTSHLTLLYTIGANGSLLDPYVILKGKKDSAITTRIIDKSFSHWMFGRTESGFINKENFLVYLQFTFHPQTLKMLEAENLTMEDQPRLLILDGHASHMGEEINKFNESHNIHMLFIPSHSSGLLQPLDIQFFRGYKSSLFDLNKKFVSGTLPEGLTITDSDTVTISIKNQLEIIFYLHNKYKQKSDLIKAAFRRICIGETISEDEIPGRLKILMETNEKIMRYRDRLFITPTEEKRIRPSYLDSSIIMSDNESVSNDADIRFTINHNTVPDSPPAVEAEEGISNEVDRAVADPIRNDEQYLRSQVKYISNNISATDRDYENLREAISHVVFPNKVGCVYNLICDLIKEKRAEQGSKSVLQMELLRMANYDEKAKKKAKKYVRNENMRTISDAVMEGTIKRRKIASKATSNNTASRISREILGLSDTTTLPIEEASQSDQPTNFLEDFLKDSTGSDTGVSHSELPLNFLDQFLSDCNQSEL